MPLAAESAILSAEAERDVERVLEETRSMFGLRQMDAYAAIIDRALSMIAQDPTRPGSTDRSALLPTLRSFPLSFATRRLRGAAHCIYYLPRRRISGRDRVVVVRVLHERMDPVARIGSAMSGGRSIPAR